MSKLHKVVICGDRNYHVRYEKILYRVIRGLVKKHGRTNLLIIEGGAPSVDTLALEIGHELNVHVAEVKALWNSRGRSAGSQRNKIMAQLEPDEVIGVHQNFTESIGTAEMLARAEKLGIKTRRYST